MNNLLPYTECLLQLILSNLLVFLLILFLNYLKILNMARKMLNQLFVFEYGSGFQFDSPESKSECCQKSLESGFKSEDSDSHKTESNGNTRLTIHRNLHVFGGSHILIFLSREKEVLQSSFGEVFNPYILHIFHSYSCIVSQWGSETTSHLSNVMKYETFRSRWSCFLTVVYMEQKPPKDYFAAPPFHYLPKSDLGYNNRKY